MKKFFYPFLIFCLFFVWSCCTTNLPSHSALFSSKQIQNLRKSFVWIRVHATIEFSNKLFVAGNPKLKLEKTTEKAYIATASGVIIGHSKTNSYVLTAEHVCETIQKTARIKMRYFLMSPKVLSMDIHLADLSGNKYTAVERIAMHSGLDACVLRTKKINQPAKAFAEHGPQIGDSVLNIAAPAGAFRIGMVPFYIGNYVGKIYDSKHENQYFVFNYFSVGGSSGSPVFDVNGDLITIHVAHWRTSHVPVGPEHVNLKKFVLKTFHTEDKIISYR